MKNPVVERVPVDERIAISRIEPSHHDLAVVAVSITPGSFDYGGSLERQIDLMAPSILVAGVMVGLAIDVRLLADDIGEHRYEAPNQLVRGCRVMRFTGPSDDVDFALTLPCHAREANAATSGRPRDRTGSRHAAGRHGPLSLPAPFRGAPRRRRASRALRPR